MRFKINLFMHIIVLGDMMQRKMMIAIDESVD